MVSHQYRNLYGGAVEIPQSTEFMWYLFETKDQSEEMFPQQITVSQSCGVRYALLKALQKKLERSLLGRQCLFRVRELGRSER